MSVVSRWFTDQFRSLVVAWERHHDLRRSGAPVPALAESRRDLDRARDEIRRLRMGFNPEPHEQGLAVGTTWCDALEIVVYLYGLPEAGGSYRCLCGSDVEPAAIVRSSAGDAEH